MGLREGPQVLVSVFGTSIIQPCYERRGQVSAILYTILCSKAESSTVNVERGRGDIVHVLVPKRLQPSILRTKETS